MDTKLTNRRVIERRLCKFIERIIVSPDVKSTIESKEVKHPAFHKALSVLDEKIAFIRLGGSDSNNSSSTSSPDNSDRHSKKKKQQSRARAQSNFDNAWLGGAVPANTVAVQQLVPELEELRRSAVSRIQEFFVSLFTDIRQAEGEQGAQMMLQNTLQKHVVSSCSLQNTCLNVLV